MESHGSMAISATKKAARRRPRVVCPTLNRRVSGASSASQAAVTAVATRCVAWPCIAHAAARYWLQACFAALSDARTACRNGDGERNLRFGSMATSLGNCLWQQ